MKFLFTIVITIFIYIRVQAQCPENNDVSVEIESSIEDSQVIVTLDKEYENIQEINVIHFGYGIVESAIIRKRSNKEFIIESLKSGEYMIQIIGIDCTTLVGTDEDYRGIIIK